MQKYSIALLTAAVSAYDYSQSKEYTGADGKGWDYLGDKERAARYHYSQTSLDHYDGSWEAEEPVHHVIPDHRFTVEHEVRHAPVAHHPDVYRTYNQHLTEPYRRMTPLDHLSPPLHGYEAEYQRHPVRASHLHSNETEEDSNAAVEAEGAADNYSYTGVHGLDGHHYGGHQPVAEAAAEHNLDHYNIRKYEEHDPHGAHAAYGHGAHAAYGHGYGHGYGHDQGYGDYGYGHEYGYGDHVAPYSHRQAEHRYFDNADHGAEETNYLRDERYHARPGVEYAHHMPEYRHRFDRPQYLETEELVAENFTPPHLYKRSKKEDAKAADDKSADKSAKEEEAAPAKDSKKDAPAEKDAEAKKSESADEKAEAPADDKEAQKEDDPSKAADAPAEEEETGEDSEDPQRKEKAKALAKEWKEFEKTELDEGDIDRFIKYCADFGKSYVNKIEFKLRLWQWKQSDNFIKANSWDARSHYKIGHNKFSDWSKHEYMNLLGYAQPAEKQAKNIVRMSNTASVASSIDWRKYGLVSDVSGQGMCGSDWAFAAIGALEGAYGVQQGKFTPLSIQQALDCTGQATSCKGGTMTQAFDYLKTAKAMTAKDYPYNTGYAQRGDECKYDEAKATSCQVDTYTFADSGDVDMMKKALSHQPIATSFNADAQSFQFYTSGVYDDESCDGTVLNHAVTLVGYGSEDGEGYWLAKNSWGSDWGEKGYFRVAIAPGVGICGIQSSAGWVVLK